MMQIQDAVKLIYQNEFGGGHMLKSKEDAYARIIAEANLRQNKKCASVPSENIGGGHKRVYLDGLSDDELLTLANAFYESANIPCGNIDSFHRKLAMLISLCSEGEFSFNEKDVKLFIDDYTLRSSLQISHSDVYKREYSPAYRVI